MDSRHHRWNENSGPTNGNVRDRLYSAPGTPANRIQSIPIPFDNYNNPQGNMGYSQRHTQSPQSYNRPPNHYNNNQHYDYAPEQDRYWNNNNSNYRRPGRFSRRRVTQNNYNNIVLHSPSSYRETYDQPEPPPYVFHTPYAQFMQTQELLAALEQDNEAGTGDRGSGDSNNNASNPSQGYSPPKYTIVYQVINANNPQAPVSAATLPRWIKPRYPAHEQEQRFMDRDIPPSPQFRSPRSPPHQDYGGTQSPQYHPSPGTWRGSNYMEQMCGPQRSPAWNPGFRNWRNKSRTRSVPAATASRSQTSLDTESQRIHNEAATITMKPEGVFHNWDLRLLTTDDITSGANEVVAQIKALFDIAANAQELSYEAILKPILEAHRYSFVMGSLCSFPRHVIGDPEIRSASAEATKTLDHASVEMGMRLDVYQKLVAYLENGIDLDSLRPEYLRALERFVQNGRRNGLHLGEDIRNEIKRIKKRVSELTLQFSRNLAEDNTTVLFTPEELSGMPEPFFEALETDSETGKFKVTLKYAHFFPVTRKCHVPTTRKILETAYQSKCQEKNTPILDEILELRHQEATLLGYANYAALSQEVLMAKSPEAVKEFLDDLTLKMKPLWNEERQVMLQLKKEECEKHGYEFDGRLEFWDFRYYLCLIEEEKYTVDQELIVEYFPVDVVINGMLSVYEDLLSLKFTYLAYADKWHEDVMVYQVSDRKTKELLGYFYLDLFARPGKFGHACCVPLQPGCLDADGVKQPAVSAMLTNFTQLKDDKPALLDHREVETFFHEFGHLMHSVCSKALTAVFFGTRVETDFVEAPSQMLENWVWEREPLRRMSAHYETNDPLPDELIQRLYNSRLACAGALNLRQLVLARFDQEVHVREGNINTQELYAQILKDVMDLDAIPGTNMPANFNHLCVGYSGRYYSYLWSEVYSQDMFDSMFKPNGVCNETIGRKYRECILEPGGSIDAIDMLRNFLGREPTNTAFLEAKGLSAKSSVDDEDDQLDEIGNTLPEPDSSEQ